MSDRTFPQLQSKLAEVKQKFINLLPATGYGTAGATAIFRTADNRTIQAECLESIAPGSPVVLLRTDAGQWFAVGEGNRPSTATIVQNRRRRPIDQPVEPAKAAVLLRKDRRVPTGGGNGGGGGNNGQYRLLAYVYELRNQESPPGWSLAAKPRYCEHFGGAGVYRPEGAFDAVQVFGYNSFGRPQWCETGFGGIWNRNTTWDEMLQRGFAFSRPQGSIGQSGAVANVYGKCLQPPPGTAAVVPFGLVLVHIAYENQPLPPLPTVRFAFYPQGQGNNPAAKVCTDFYSALPSDWVPLETIVLEDPNEGGDPDPEPTFEIVPEFWVLPSNQEKPVKLIQFPSGTGQVDAFMEIDDRGKTYVSLRTGSSIVHFVVSPSGKRVSKVDTADSWRSPLVNSPSWVPAPVNNACVQESLANPLHNFSKDLKTRFVVPAIGGFPAMTIANLKSSRIEIPVTAQAVTAAATCSIGQTVESKVKLRKLRGLEPDVIVGYVARATPIA